MRAPIALSLALCLSLFPSFASAEEAAPEGEGANKPVYVDLTPALVGNYGSGPRLQYYKADIALQVADKDAATKVEHHEPLIRNQLIMLFAQQTDQSLGTVEAKESLRQEALKQVQQTLEQEEGKPLVTDLLFNNLIVQP
ncbi:TPA: flagellar basal body-associated protein FliL [Pseudomonas aeruginosa]|nr:flagellar basal body-associated protein FliL [Pseudomonas aeruginosa]